MPRVLREEKVGNLVVKLRQRLPDEPWYDTEYSIQVFKNDRRISIFDAFAYGNDLDYNEPKVGSRHRGRTESSAGVSIMSVRAKPLQCGTLQHPSGPIEPCLGCTPFREYNTHAWRRCPKCGGFKIKPRW